MVSVPDSRSRLGAIFLVAFWIGDDTRSGVFSFGVMAVLAGLILLGGRSEMVRGLRGDGRDEYWAGIDERATPLHGERRDRDDHRNVRLGVGSRT